MSVTKKWSSCDILTLELPITLRLEAVEGNNSKALPYLSVHITTKSIDDEMCTVSNLSNTDIKCDKLSNLVKLISEVKLTNVYR